VLFYFAGKNKTIAKGNILFSKILGVEKAPPDVKKKFCFAVKTPNRTYLIHAEEEEDMKNWMRSIENISELHKTKDKFDGRYIFLSLSLSFFLSPSLSLNK
jgi:hypothetical protein